jgi:hypothetical protein
MGIVNTHNIQNWAQEDPHFTRERERQVRWSLNVWAGLQGDCIIGPYLLPERLTAATYYAFMDEALPVLPEDVPPATRELMWYQLDGAPQHLTSC